MQYWMHKPELAHIPADMLTSLTDCLCPLRHTAGWKDTGNKTSLGKPIYEGICTSCHKQCTVPFAPLAGGKPPKCKSCLNAAEDQIERDYIENYIATFTQEIDDDPDVDDEFKTHCKEELRKDLEELCQEQKQQRQQHLQSQRDQHKKSSSQLLPGEIYTKGRSCEAIAATCHAHECPRPGTGYQPLVWLSFCAVCQNGGVCGIPQVAAADGILSC